MNTIPTSGQRVVKAGMNKVCTTREWKAKCVVGRREEGCPQQGKAREPQARGQGLQAVSHLYLCLCPIFELPHQQVNSEASK